MQIRRDFPLRRPTYLSSKQFSETPPTEQRSSPSDFSARSKQWRLAMSAFKILIAAALLSTATISSASAAWSFADQEPAAFASMYPDRDVLNGGALTPAGRMGLERPGGAAPVFGVHRFHNQHWRH